MLNILNIYNEHFNSKNSKLYTEFYVQNGVPLHFSYPLVTSIKSSIKKNIKVSNVKIESIPTEFSSYNSNNVEIISFQVLFYLPNIVNSPITVKLLLNSLRTYK